MIVVDRDAAAGAVAAEIGGVAIVADVGIGSEVERLVHQTLEAFGSIDLFCSNAGVGGGRGDLAAPVDDWDPAWRINVMAHVHAARAVVPAMLAAGGGYLLQTASAAGLLTQLGSAPYSATKHAAVAFAEWLAITYGDRGIKVSCLCPQGVRTAMLESAPPRIRKLLGATALDPAQVADAVVTGLAEERFLILPHPEVAEYFRRKAADYDRWIRGMRRLQAELQ